jgi:nucleoside-diphosphate-sugar epimerase
MKALVTGANGFIGSHLVEELLARGHVVRCFVRRTSDLRWLAGRHVQYAYGDVGDAVALARAVEGVDGVFHVAGITRAFSGEEFRRVNVEGTRRILEAAAARSGGPPRVVHLSSIAAAGPSFDGVPAREGDACRPVSLYGASKAAAETAVRAFADRVPATIVRPPIVYGPRDRGVLALFRMAARGIVLQAGLARRLFSIVHVRDLARGVADVGERGRALSSSRGTEGIYYLADGAYAWADLARAAGEALGRTVRVIRLPRALTCVAALSGDLVGRLRGRPFVVNLDKVREGTRGHWVCQSSSAREQLGFAPEYGLARGFEDTAGWYRDHGWL